MEQMRCLLLLTVLLALACPAAGKTAAARGTGLVKCVIEIGGKALDPKTHAIVLPGRGRPGDICGGEGSGSGFCAHRRRTLRSGHP